MLIYLVLVYPFRKHFGFDNQTKKQLEKCGEFVYYHRKILVIKSTLL